MLFEKQKSDILIFYVIELIIFVSLKTKKYHIFEIEKKTWDTFGKKPGFNGKPDMNTLSKTMVLNSARIYTFQTIIL